MSLFLKLRGFSMRVFKWVPEFSPLSESAIAPVWVRLEGLPLYMFDEITLLTISNAIGKPIRVDPRNVNHSMLNSARICVELDVSKTLTDAIWVCFEDETSKNLLDGFWVKVFYDVVPKFCTFCSHIGHGMDVCKRRLDVSSKTRCLFHCLNQCYMGRRCSILSGDRVVLDKAKQVQIELAENGRTTSDKDQFRTPNLKTQPANNTIETLNVNNLLEVINEQKEDEALVKNFVHQQDQISQVSGEKVVSLLKQDAAHEQLEKIALIANLQEENTVTDGFTTPEKKADAPTATPYATTTRRPSSWAESVEKEEEQAKAISKLDASKVSEYATKKI
ncbi:hypothetical protein Leryth_024600 [Lithospermum erythrorhizon]|nr:hypothetical protein Leryth_024600 [Lithospermum erythrorhizon]